MAHDRSELERFAQIQASLKVFTQVNRSTATLDAVREEMADVQIYLLMLANKLNVDLLAGVEKKIETNAAKYPIDKAAGRNAKYTKL